MTKNKSLKIIKQLKQEYGNVSTELAYINIYELSIAVILSAQTTDKQVNAVTPILFGKYTDFKCLSQATISDVEDIIKSIGLYKTKARNIINLSHEIIESYNGILPKTLGELIKLPGIGRKSANVILSVGFDKAAFAVDTHIKRIANRIGYKSSEDVYKIEQALTYYIPKEEWKVAHLLFIKHGRSICKARRPLCSECPIINLCDRVGVEDNIS